MQDRRMTHTDFNQLLSSITALTPEQVRQLRQQLDCQSAQTKNGTDLENRANFDREDGSTGDAQMRFKKIGAWGHAARHAIKRVE
jgi:hypothetical protein